MTTPDGLTAEAEALLRNHAHSFIRDDETWRDRLAAIEAAAVARHVAAERGTPSAAETGCDGLDAEMESWLSMEEHAEVEVRLLSYSPAMHVWVRHTRRKPGTRQKYVRTDAYGPTLTAALAQLRAALTPTVAASEACAREGCGHYATAHDEGDWTCDDCGCEEYLAPTVAASEEERPLTPGEIRAANDIMRALGAPIPPEAPSPAIQAELRGGEG